MSWWEHGGLPLFRPDYVHGGWHVTDICDQCGWFRDAHFSPKHLGPIGGPGGPGCTGGGPWRQERRVIEHWATFSQAKPDRRARVS